MAGVIMTRFMGREAMTSSAGTPETISSTGMMGTTRSMGMRVRMISTETTALTPFMETTERIASGVETETTSCLEMGTMTQFGAKPETIPSEEAAARMTSLAAQEMTRFQGMEAAIASMAMREMISSGVIVRTEWATTMRLTKFLETPEAIRCTEMVATIRSMVVPGSILFMARRATIY